MRQAFRLLERIVVFVVLWWVLSEGDASSWLFGVPFVVFASAASLKLTPKRDWRLQPLSAVRFAWFFATQSVVGGVDVALRALRPSMPLEPAFVEYPVRLPGQAARVLLANTVSLLPGTLSSGLEGDTLIMHVLDHTQPIVAEVARVEEHIAATMGLEISDSPSHEGSRDA